MTRSDPLPGFNIEILRVEGGTGAGGNLLPGDRPRVTFTARNDAGAAIPASSWSFQELLFSGPTTNYQLILQTRAIAANATQNADGSWTFTSPDAIPAIVPPQINQEDTIPYDSGTLAGQALPSGTYTVGMSMRQDVTIAGTSFRDATSTTFDVLLGNATTLQHPQLVTDANCQNCHTVLRAHGENRYGVRMCVMCHTNGAEDLNNPNAVAGETLGLTISFQTMIHKIHSGTHLPSVNGKTVDNNGDPVYGPGKPYVIVRSRGEFDFSHVAFPQWPHLSQGMPRDIGYPGPGSARTAENAILSGPTNCMACHGDPDGSGPLPPPANGDAIFTNQIVTRACIACHDDWDPLKPYSANGQTMPAGLGDQTCTACHGETPTNPNSAINVRKAHTHPLLDTNDPPLWGPGAGAKGLKFNVIGVQDIPSAGLADGVIQAGEKVEVTLDVVDGSGAAIAGADVRRMEIVISGPTENPNLLYVQAFSTNPAPTALLGAGPRHTFVLPERFRFELATPITATQFGTARAPHYPTQFGAWGATEVWEVPTGGVGGTTVAAAVKPYQNYIDVASTTGIATGNLIVVDESNAAIEYLEVRNVDVANNRIWISAPVDVCGIQLTKAHAVGASVKVVNPALLTPTATNPTAGTVTLAAPPTGNVLISYATDYVVPDQYRGSINNSPAVDPLQPRVDAMIGEWTGFALVPGTYNIGVYGEISFTVTVNSGGSSQATGYTEGSQGNTVVGFRVGTAGQLTTSDRISDAANCYSCHRDLQFHGAHRRGFNNCMLCHGSSGSEDWPAFKSAGFTSPETPGVAIEFREMIHKIHRGHELAAGADYVVAGFNGSSHTYEHVGFPSFLGGTANCAACHGAENTAWHEPTIRLHPDQPRLAPQLTWRMVCGSCHDDRPALAHIVSNSGGNVEGCAICHGAGKDNDVELVHKHLRR